MSKVIPELNPNHDSDSDYDSDEEERRQARKELERMYTKAEEKLLQKEAEAAKGKGSSSNSNSNSNSTNPGDKSAERSVDGDGEIKNKTKRVKILRKTKDETPDQRKARKTQEIQRQKSRERRKTEEELSITDNKSDMDDDENDSGNRDTASTPIPITPHQPEKKSKKEEPPPTLDKRPTEEIDMTDREWALMIEDMFLVRKGCFFCLKVISDEVEINTFTHYFREKESRSTRNTSGNYEVIQKNPFAKYKWVSTFLGELTNLENTADKKGKTEVKAVDCKLEALDENNAEKIANALQVFVRQSKPKKAIARMLEKYPSMRQCNEECQWFMPVTYTFCWALSNELRKKYFQRFIFLLIFCQFCIVTWDMNVATKDETGETFCIGCQVMGRMLFKT